MVAYKKFKFATFKASEERELKTRLNELAIEVYKVKTIKRFLLSLSVNRNIRNYNKVINNLILYHSLSSGFQKFKQGLAPALENRRKNMVAVKHYVINLYNAFFNKWKIFAVRKNLFKDKRDIIRKRSPYWLKKRFIKGLEKNYEIQKHLQFKANKLYQKVNNFRKSHYWRTFKFAVNTNRKYRILKNQINNFYFNKSMSK